MTIRKRIEHIVEFAASVNSMKWDNPLRDGQDKMLWQRIDALQVEIGGGLVPGRHLRWNVADGYAHYLVVKVNKRDVELVHLDYMDGYWFQGCWQDDDGRVYCARPVAEQAYRWHSGLKKIFEKS